MYKELINVGEDDSHEEPEDKIQPKEVINSTKLEKKIYYL